MAQVVIFIERSDEGDLTDGDSWRQTRPRGVSVE